MILIPITFFLLHFAASASANEYFNLTLAKQSLEIVELGIKSFYDCLRKFYALNVAYSEGLTVENFTSTLISKNNVSYWLYTRKNQKNPEIFNTYNPQMSIKNSKYFDVSKQTVIYVHQYMGKTNESAKTMVPALLPKQDINLIFVDWDSYSFIGLYYTIIRLGKIVAEFCNQLITIGVNPKNMFLIGYSSGGQIVGGAAKEIKPKIAKILAIDPEGNCFNLLPPQYKINKMDGDFVQIIHCTAGTFAREPFLKGDVTIYMNGGLIQPQCRNASAADESGCSHSTCDLYFNMALENPREYAAFKCPSYFNYILDLCNCQDKTVIGYYTPTSLKGDYFVQTSSANKTICGFKGGANPNKASYGVFSYTEARHSKYAQTLVLEGSQ